MEYNLRNIVSQDTITLIFLGVFLMLAVLRNLYPKRFIEFLQLPVTDKYFSFEGKSQTIQHPFNLFLFSIQVIAFSLFTFFVLKNLNPTKIENNPWLLLQIITVFFVFIVSKYIIENIIAIIFNIEPLMNKYLFEKLSYLNLIGGFVLLLTLSFFYIYSPSQGVITFVILAIVVLYSISIFSSVKRHNQLILSHFFYFILYLCALEICPYVILYKLVVYL